MNDLQTKICPFCGQYLMCEPDVDPRDVCKCDKAKDYQHRQTICENRLRALDKLCGSDCDKLHPDYQPVGEETYELLKQIVRGVCFGQIGKTKFSLPDDTELSIAETGIKRTAKITAQFAQ